MINFHTEFNQEPHAAVNVKVYFVPAFSLMEPYFLRFWDEFHYEEYCEHLFNSVAHDFWEENVQVMARDAGFAGAYSEGRSAGWAVPYYNNGGGICYITNKPNSEDIINYTKFKTSVEKYLAHLNDNILKMLIEKWYELEKDFIRRHSVTARAMEAFT